MYQQFKMIDSNSFKITVWDNPRYPTVIKCDDIVNKTFTIPKYLKESTQKDIRITINKICDVLNKKCDSDVLWYKKYENIIHDVRREIK